MAKDATIAPSVLRRLAAIYGCVGESDSALELLERLVHIPAGVSYGKLKLDSDWDPLWKDPRFDQLLAALAPKPGV